MARLWQTDQEAAMSTANYAPIVLWLGIGLIFILLAVLFSLCVWASTRISKLETASLRRATWVGVPQALVMAAVIVSAQLSKKANPLPAIFMAVILAVLLGMVLVWRVYRTKGSQTLKVWIIATLLQVLAALPIGAGLLMAWFFIVNLIFPPMY